jgi:cyclic pyranopterin phosphate synthase
MPEEEYAFAPASRLMRAPEIEALSTLFVQNGVDKIRLTGGEPLVRKDAADIIRSLSKLPVKLTLTTNGTRVHEFIDVLKDAGIKSLNISLDTLERDKFQLLTKRDLFDRIYENIQLLLCEHFHVKINMVVMKGVNEQEIIPFIQWTKDVPVHVRFIEFMPFSGNRWVSDKVFTWQQILQLVGEQFDTLPLKGEPNDTAKKYTIPGHQGSFAVISTMSAPFCSDCNRMRLTADGKMKNCLFSSFETDLLTPFRNGEDVLPLIQQNIAAKAKELGGQFTTDFEHLTATAIQNRSMITIGG